MPVKQASKRKRVTRAAVPALGAAGLTFSLAGGAAASTVPAADTAQKLNFSPTQGVLLGEEEIGDGLDIAQELHALLDEGRDFFEGFEGDRPGGLSYIRDELAC